MIHSIVYGVLQMQVLSTPAQQTSAHKSLQPQQQRRFRSESGTAIQQPATSDVTAAHADTSIANDRSLKRKPPASGERLGKVVQYVVDADDADVIKDDVIVVGKSSNAAISQV